MQSERTIYTVECRDGAWAGDRCASLSAGPRYQLSCLDAPQRSDLLDRGLSRPSGKFGDCAVRMDLWICKPNADAPLDPADGRRRTGAEPASVCRPFAPSRVALVTASAAGRRMARCHRRSGAPVG
jgi:hypothetical protein